MLKKAVMLLFTGVFTVAAATAQKIEDAIQAIDNEQYDSAKAMLKKINDEESAYYLGDIYLKEGAVAEAKKAFQQGIQEEDKFPLNYIGLGRIAFSQGDKAAGESQIQEGLDHIRGKYKRDPRAYVEAMKAYGNAGIYDKGIEYGNKAVEVDPENARVYLALGELYRKRDGTNLSNAVSNYQKAIHYDPNNAEAYTQLGVAWMRAQQPDRAKQYLDKAVSVDPKFAPAYRVKADMSYLQYEKDRDEAKLKEAMSLYEDKYLPLVNRSCDALTSYVQFAFLAHEVEKANKAIAEIRQNCEAIPQLGRMEGYSAYETGDYQKAADVLNKFVKESPKDMLIKEDYIYLSKAYAKLDQPQEAIKSLDGAIEMADTTNMAGFYKIYDDIAAALMEAEKYPAAAQVYQQKIDKFGKNGDYPGINRDYINLGKAYFSGEEYEKADKVYAKLIERDSDYMYGYYMRAVSNAQLDPEMKTGRAKPYYEELIKQTAKDPEKYKPFLTEAYRYMGSHAMEVEDNIDKTIEYYQKWAAIDPENKQVTEAIQKLKERKQKVAEYERQLREYEEKKRQQQNSGGE